jgi:outer membrane biosynthesis protein TonB
MPTGYCVKCRSKKEFNNGVEKETKNGRRMMQGNCKTCKTKVNVFLKSNKPKDSKPKPKPRAKKVSTRPPTPGAKKAKPRAKPKKPAKKAAKKPAAKRKPRAKPKKQPEPESDSGSEYTDVDSDYLSDAEMSEYTDEESE